MSTAAIPYPSFSVSAAPVPERSFSLCSFGASLAVCCLLFKPNCLVDQVQIKSSLNPPCAQ